MNHTMPYIKFGITHGIIVIMLLLLNSSYSFAVSQNREPNIAYANTTSSHVTTFIRGKDPVVVKSFNLVLDFPSKVVVQFSSGITAEDSTGCPCSVRALVAMDGGEPRIVKRINVGTPAAHDVDKYQYDRQSLDGATVFEAPTGEHTFEVIFRQAGSEAKKLEVNYPNIQVMAFPE